MPKKPDILPLNARPISSRIKEALDLCTMVTSSSSTSAIVPPRTRPTLAVSQKLTRSANNLSTRRSPASPHSRMPVCPLKGMEHEEERLVTYLRWPALSMVSTDRLARAGFFFTGQGDTVQCFSCGGQLDKWQLGDDVMKKHRLNFPTCSFVCGSSSNVPYFKTEIESKLHLQFLESMDSGFDVRSSVSHPTTPSSLVQQPVREGARSSCSRYGTVDSAYRSLSRRRSTCGSVITEVMTDGQDMKSEKNRLKSFLNFPHHLVKFQDLAAAGFFYTGFQDRVRCAYCAGILGTWQRGDDPAIEHRKHFPWCNFEAKEYGSDYSSTQSSPTSAAPSSGIDVSGSGVPQIVPSKYPCSPYLANYQVRLGTFKNWSNRIQVPEHLALAGFFFTGVNDNVRCFHCDGGLRCWSSSDDAWEEHAKWFPQCPYLVEVKGANYVENIQKAVLENNGGLTAGSRGRALRLSVVSTPTTPVAPADEESVVRRVLEMGLPLPSVEQAIRERRSACIPGPAKPFINVEELMNSVLELENRRKPEGSSPGKVASSFFAKLKNSKKDSKKSVEDLTAENKRLLQQRKCKICCDKEISIAFLPCGHLMVCSECAPLLRTCPQCRLGIRGTLKTFLS
ncbi:hypothetical protein RvY_15687 [Ramazzottius varieornatus]|uniref:RING-type domain-containing protein n=1 Tax=Ramazzottius varieornatus TaxID=947166 RepID=A0A1D1VYY3_RAMVA|nr:hypothetical protein RvY_15687 [Ramazzottius varieornatus]